MEPDGEQPRGVIASAKRLLDTIVAVVCNRVELLAVETREEAQHWLAAFLLAAALASLGTLALAMISLTIVMACWEEHRLAALVVLSVLYLLATAVVGWRLRRRLRTWSSFSATIGELRKDKARWEEQKNEQAATPQTGPDSGK